MQTLREYFEGLGLDIKQVAQKTGYSPLYIRNLFNCSDDPNDKMRFRFKRAFPDMPDFLLYPVTEETGKTNGKSEA